MPQSNAIITKREFWIWATGKDIDPPNPLATVIDDMIDAASDQIESYTRRKYAAASAITDEPYDGTGTRILRLSRIPVVSVASITIETSPTGSTLDPSEYEVYASTGLVIANDSILGVRGWPRGYRNILVTNTAGGAAPAPAKLAAKYLVGQHWFTRGREPSVGSEAGGQFSRQKMSAIDPRSGLPLVVVQLLAPLKRMLIATSDGVEVTPLAEGQTRTTIFS